MEAAAVLSSDSSSAVLASTAVTSDGYSCLTSRLNIQTALLLRTLRLRALPRSTYPGQGTGYSSLLPV